MAGTNRGTADVDKFVGGVDSPLREIVTALRETVRESAPDLREEIVMGIPTYSLQGFVCYIAPYTRHVNLGFHRGALFPNPPSILEGTGKGLRHVKVRTAAEAQSPLIRALVRTAVANDRPRERQRTKGHGGNATRGSRKR
ncbi:MAG: DUF1801 domain-containing protein [Methanobacteriota archaeon]|nr:MAG: DUF1801 domain-containing protein [Euryarchaeota archaeon]